MVILRRGKPTQRRAQHVVREEPGHDARETVVRDLAGEELQEPVELVRVPPQAGAIAGSRVRRRLERPDVDLEPVAELLDATEHAHGVALRKARVEQLDVVPDACLDAAARIDELECEIRGAALRAQPLLARDRVDAFDDPLFGQLCDRAHDVESR